MNYLYGDSTKSPLKSNFLEFLRDALDFSAVAVEAEHAIRNGREDVKALQREAAAEIGRLETFVAAVTSTIDAAPKGDAEKTTARTAAQLRSLAGDVLAASIASVRQQLAADIAAADAAEADQRARCLQALEILLLRHDPPDASTVTQIVWGDGNAYTASLAGQAAFGLTWQLTLSIPATDAWASPIRVERWFKQFSIRAPQLAGWISKEVKIKPQRLERHVVTALVDDGSTVTFELRAESEPESGFDFEVNPESGRITAARVGPQGDKEDGSLGAFDVDAEDAPRLVELAAKLRASTEGLERSALDSAAFGDTAFSEQDFANVVQRLVAMMAPITHAISDRSLMPNELVIRRLLGDDRREEIFVTKQSLREKYTHLPAPFLPLFSPLGLDTVPPRKKSEPPPADTTVVVRSELPPSIPPAQAAPQAPPVEIPPAPAVPSNGAPRRNEAIVARVKKAITLAKKGEIATAYKEYETLFSSDEFAEARAEDQRQALKLMVMAKLPTPLPEPVVEALLAAILRLQKLVEAYKEPADLEILGVGYQLIDDSDAALRVFTEALEIERARNAESELCTRLTTRVAETRVS